MTAARDFYGPFWKPAGGATGQERKGSPMPSVNPGTYSVMYASHEPSGIEARYTSQGWRVVMLPNSSDINDFFAATAWCKELCGDLGEAWVNAIIYKFIIKDPGLALLFKLTFG